MIYKSLHFQQMQNSTVMYFKLISSYIFWLNCHHQGADTIVLKLNSNKIFNDAYTYQMYWLKFIRNKMFLYIFILTLYGMSFLCEVRYETVHGSVCCYMCINQCACAMLLPCLCYCEEWAEVRDILLFNQKSFLLVNLYVGIFPAIESCSFTTWLYQWI